MKLSRRIELYRDEVPFGNFKDELKEEAIVLEIELKDTQADLTQCRKELELLTAVCHKKCKPAMEEVKAERDRLKEYCHHHKDCSKPFAGPCTCGLDKLLEELI